MGCVFCPFPIGEFLAVVGFGVEEFMGVVIDAFAGCAGEGGVGVFSEDPAGGKGFVEGVDG